MSKERCSVRWQGISGRGGRLNGRGGAGMEVCVMSTCVFVCVWLPASASQRGSTVLRWSSSKRPLLLVAMTTPTSAPALRCPLKPSGRQSSARPGSREREREREGRREREEKRREKNERRKRKEKKERNRKTQSLKQPVAFDSCPVCHSYLPLFPSQHTNKPDTQYLHSVDSSHTSLSFSSQPLCTSTKQSPNKSETHFVTLFHHIIFSNQFSYKISPLSFHF